MNNKRTNKDSAAAKEPEARKRNAAQSERRKRTDNRQGCNLKFSPVYWQMLEDLTKQCGFRSTYEMFLTIIQCFVRYVARRRGEIDPDENTSEDVASEIDGMFSAFGDYEATPTNTPRSIFRRNACDYDQVTAEEHSIEDHDEEVGEYTSIEDPDEDVDEYTITEDENDEEPDESD